MYIHWDNPYVWASDTVPIETKVSTNLTQITLPCDAEKAGKPRNPGGPPSPDTSCNHDAFVLSSIGGTPINPGSGVDYYAFVSDTGKETIEVVVTLFFPLLQAIILATNQDVNLEFKVGLRPVGSGWGTINKFYDGSKGIHPLAIKYKQSSLRKLFSLP